MRRRVRHVVTEIERVRAVRRAGPGRPAGATSGRSFDASHASMRDDYEISCRELDLVVEAARGAGALGARMTGGGFGGSAIALVPAERYDAIAAAVLDAFERQGLREPAVVTAYAAPGAARDR